MSKLIITATALLGATTGNKSLELRIPEEVKLAALKKFGIDLHEPVVAVHPWTSDPVKQWPLERFKALVDGLAISSLGRVVIIGKPEPWHQPVVFAGKNITDLSGKTTLVEAAAVLGHCRCLVSCDSGPVHLASAVGTSVVALFRNDMPGKNPERWGPWGKGHQVIQAAGMDKICVDDVSRAVDQITGKV